MFHKFADPSQITLNYSDLSLMGSSSSNNTSSFSHDQELGTTFSLLQQQHCFDLRMLTTPGNSFHDNGFISEVPVDSMVAASGMFYDPTMSHSVLNHGTAGGSLFFEEDYSAVQMDQKIQLGSKRKNRGVEQGTGGTKNEKQRRLRLSSKYEVLKALIPNPSKPDRATIIADSIDYIQELLRSADELKLLVEKKRRRKLGSKKAEIDASVDMESSCVKPFHLDLKGSLRSSWIQRKSRDTHVDVRIVEDEVFIKLTQHKKIEYCLLAVARVLDELQLEILHLSGGNIGDLHVFMFNTKIHEGSSVYAGAIAKKILEAMDVKYSELIVC